MNKTLLSELVQKKERENNNIEEKQRRIDQILKRQTEHDVLRPAGSRKYKNWNDVKSVLTDQPRIWLQS